LKIRHDHWVPYCILSGLPDRSIADEIISQCVKVYAQPLGYYRLPLKKTEGVFPGWRIPEQVISTTNSLCKALNEESIVDKIKEAGLTLHWERDEFQAVVEEEKQAWPEYIKHEKLNLIRNRYPVVPGFDNKTRSDILQEPLQAPTPPASYKDLMKKPKRWKVKNEIPKEGQIHRYGSKFGKTFPILKKTALTSRFRKQE
jgi:hypothetical protein